MNKKKIIIIYFLFLVLKFSGKNSSKKSKDNDYKKIEIFYILCNKGILLNKNFFKRNNNPKISIISPIYNKEKYLLRYLRSVQNQFFDNIEIILVNDNSKDGSLEKIDKLMKKDERVLLIKNKNNRGTLRSRNDAVLFSNGKYLIFLDPDDILSYDILTTCYNISESRNYEILRFNIYEGNGKIVLSSLINDIINKEITQPDLYLYLFYGTNNLKQLDYFITNKLIKRDLFIKVLNLIDKYYLNNFMIDCEDGLINFMLYRLSNSYYFIKNIGYYYLINENSITKKINKQFIRRIKSNFLYLKYLFLNTKNNAIEKNIVNFVFSEIYTVNKDIFIDIFNKVTDIKFYMEIIYLFLNCKYISIQVKEILNNIILLIDKKYYKIYIK